MTSEERASLEQRFYDLSRSLHPDRFATQGALALADSVQRMSEINEAYRILRDPNLRRQHLLELEAVEVGKLSPDLELAEAWFELQEDVTPERLRAFNESLETQASEITEGIRQAEEEFDRTGDRAQLEKLGCLIQRGNYLKSLQADVQRFAAGKV